MASKLAAHYEGETYGLAIRSRMDRDRMPVVLLHGWGDTKAVFDGAFESEAMRAYNLLSIDLPGFGSSEKPRQFSYAIEDQAGVVASIIKHKFPKGAHIVGHSMGGAVGLIAAQELNKRALSFTSIEGNLYPQDTSNLARRIAAMPRQLFRFIGQPAIGAALLSHTDKANRAWGRGWLAASPTALQQSARSLAYWSDSSALEALFIRTPRRAYIGGADSRRFITAQQRLPAADVHGIAGSGHIPMRANPSECYAVLGRILGEYQT